MGTFDEYAERAKRAEGTGDHVAVLMSYAAAIEWSTYGEDAQGVLKAAVSYAAQLKREGDRKAVAFWAETTLGRITAGPDLSEILHAEIAKLQIGGEQNAKTAT